VILSVLAGMGQLPITPALIDGKRRKRIARDSGISVLEVNQVLKQYLQMGELMKLYGALAAKGRLKGLGKLSGA
jgi:signal recognition particle subunit SRP54